MQNKIIAELSALGADIIGFGDITELPAAVRENMPVGISVAVAYPKEVIRGIAELPTQEYREHYDRINELLDSIVAKGAELLREMGYNAVAQSREYVFSREGVKFEDNTVLPQKTIATRAGIGWIGKCALLVTEEYGSAIRLSSILTDAPFEKAKPVNKSLCGNCMMCKEACPGDAVSGKPWEAGLDRDEFFDSEKCRKTARERAKSGFGGDMTICGKCIEICPHTRRYTE